ncbi:carbohydrate ABC transporter permease [Enterococcus sp.]|uniref:carbohydrate ABC transporter permease n=1 Tax=Enterococcus sp. TaxID=35783 RepID=UPI002FC9A52B
MNNKLSIWTIRLILVMGVIFSLFPFYWMLVMSSQDMSALYSVPPVLVFGSNLFEHIKIVFEQTSFIRSFFNSLFIATTSTILILFFDSLAGFSFAKLKFKGKNILFVFLLGTMMIPGQLNIIPQFLMMDKIGWIGSYKALIIPSMANAFGIFWIKQYAEDAIPDSILESARMDGCSTFRIYWNIALPILKPAMAFLAIYSFMGSWNDYMWPLIVLNDEAKYTLMLALTQLQGVYYTDYTLVITGSLLATIPLLVVFSLFSKQMMAGLTAGAVKE